MSESVLVCEGCKRRYVESGDSEAPAEIGGGMLDMEPTGYGYHAAYGVCGLCFLYAMFGTLLEPWRDSKAIYGIGCPSDRQPDPDWDEWEAAGYEGWPPPPRAAAVDESLPF